MVYLGNCNVSTLQVRYLFPAQVSSVKTFTPALYTASSSEFSDKKFAEASHSLKGWFSKKTERRTLPEDGGGKLNNIQLSRVTLP